MALQTRLIALTSRPQCRCKIQYPAADHEPAGGFLGDRSRVRGAGQNERAADDQRFFALQAIVSLGGLSGAILLDSSLSG